MRNVSAIGLPAAGTRIATRSSFERHVAATASCCRASQLDGDNPVSVGRVASPDSGTITPTAG